MYLRQLDIVEFRGIKRLSITLRPNMVLIGENAWGKSSLLAALSLILNPENKLYQFTEGDFHLSFNNVRSTQITLLFTFSERDVNEDQAKINSGYQALFMPHEDGFDRIYLRVTGDLNEQNVTTTYSFLNGNGEPIGVGNVEELALALIARHPIYRFRDARLNKRKLHSPTTYFEPLDDEIIQELQAVEQLLQYYFIDRQGRHYLSQDSSLLWERAKTL